MGVNAVDSRSLENKNIKSNTATSSDGKILLQLNSNFFNYSCQRYFLLFTTDTEVILHLRNTKVHITKNNQTKHNAGIPVRKLRDKLFQSICFEHICWTIYMHLIQLMPYTVASINIFIGGTTILTLSAFYIIINQANPSTLNIRAF